LIRIAHSGSPLLNAAGVNLGECNWLPREPVVPSEIPRSLRRHVQTGSKNKPVEAPLAAASAVAARGSKL
jgi:hypothetical protein